MTGWVMMAGTVGGVVSRGMVAPMMLELLPASSHSITHSRLRASPAGNSTLNGNAVNGVFDTEARSPATQPADEAAGPTCICVAPEALLSCAGTDTLLV